MWRWGARANYSSLTQHSTGRKSSERRSTGRKRRRVKRQWRKRRQIKRKGKKATETEREREEQKKRTEDHFEDSHSLWSAQENSSRAMQHKLRAFFFPEQPNWVHCAPSVLAHELNAFLWYPVRPLKVFSFPRYTGFFFYSDLHLKSFLPLPFIALKMSERM